jgi:thiamine-phosphate pyrophosphorylase
MKQIDLSLYLVTDPKAVNGVVETAIAAAKGGATIIQLRDKQASDEAMIEQGKALKRALLPFDIPLIINDRLAVALACDADGLHIGQSDGDLQAMRQAMGDKAIIGLSIDQPDQLSAEQVRLTDYYGIGPIFPTSTKPGHAPPIGFDGLAKICQQTAKPCVAIGGLTSDHATSVKAAGATGIAIVSAICMADDPEQATRDIVESWRRT